MIRSSRIAVTAAIAALALAGTACGEAEQTAEGAPASGTMTVNDLTVTAFDYAYEMPDTVAAGQTRIRLVNNGPELHHVWIVKLEEGKRLPDLMEAMQAHGPLPSWVKSVGGPNTPVPGGESQAVVDLPAGDYAVLCVIPSPDGAPHIMKGMTKEFTVVEGRATETVEVLAPTVDVRLVDYDFQFSQPLTAGRHALRVTTNAPQPHEIVIVKLAPGTTATDMAAWVHAPTGPPPGMPIGGTTVVDNGGENIVLVDLEPGEYALLCFLPDAGDGRPHSDHGMVQQIAIR